MSNKEKNITFNVQKGRQQQAFESDADVILYGGAAACISGDTEFLSRNGWKRIDQYEYGDEVLQYNANNNTATFVEPIKYIKAPCDSLTHFEARGISQILSPEHRVLYYNDHAPTKPKVISFEEMRRRHEASKTKGFTGGFKTTFEYSGSGIDMTEGELRLQVAVNADGHLVKKDKTGNYFTLVVSKDRKAERMNWLIEKFNLNCEYKGCKYAEKYANKRQHSFTGRTKLPFKRFTEYYYNCSKEQLEIIFDEIFHWDGSFKENQKHTTYVYYSKHKQDADFVQFMCHALGYNTSIVIDRRENKPCYTVNASMAGKGFRRLANKDGKIEMKDIPTEDGYKYCFEVPSSFFVIRHNNKITVTGNSGKSRLLLLRALFWAYDDPLCTGVLFRRTMPAMLMGDSLWSESERLYAPLKPQVKLKDREFIFRGGGKIKYSGLEMERDAEKNFQGSQLTFAGFDELTHFEQSQFVYIISRIRSESKKQHFVMGTMNPDKNSWVLNWVSWYLDKDGYPDPAKNGVKRHFLLVEDKPVFADTAEELVEKYPDLCYTTDESTGEVHYVRPMTIACIFGTIYDNPEILRTNPSYLSKLKSQTTVNRARLLDGNWFADVEGATYFERGWLGKISYRNLPKNMKWCRAYDKAATEPSEKNRYPDYTASILMGKDRDGNIYICGDYIDRFRDPLEPEIYGRFRLRAGIRDSIIEEQAQFDGSDVTVVLPKDPSSAGQVEYLESAKKLNRLGFIVKPDPMPSNKTKLTRFMPFSSACQNGSVFIAEDTFPNPQTLESLYVELESFDESRSTASRKDDRADACASGYNFLSKEKVITTAYIPTTNAPTLKQKYGL